jgi:hypothetical protein
VGRAGEIPSPYESSGIPDSVHNNYLAGCEQTAQTKAGCECLFDNLTTKQGIDTQEKLKALADKVKTATQSPNPAAAMPPEFRQAALACKASLVKTQ